MNDTLIKFGGECSTMSCGYTGEHGAGVAAHINKIFAQEIFGLSTQMGPLTNVGGHDSQNIASVVANSGFGRH